MVCDEFVAQRINLILSRLQGNVTLVVAVPPPIRVIWSKATTSSVGLRLRNPGNEIVIDQIQDNLLQVSLILLHVLLITQ